MLGLFHLIFTLSAPYVNFFCGWGVGGGGLGRCVGTFDLQNIPEPRSMGKIPRLFSERGKTPELTIPVGGEGEGGE